MEVTFSDVGTVTIDASREHDLIKEGNNIRKPNLANVSVISANLSAVPPLLKKRGRPRKYGPAGKRSAAPQTPMPISAAVPLSVVDFSQAKRSKGRAFDKVKIQFHSQEEESLGDIVQCSGGTNFMPRILTIAAGEDVAMNILSLSQQGPHAICILSANGVLSNVTLRQPDTSGGTMTYEGRFEILSLTGSFMPIEKEGTKGRSGGMSISISSPEGRVVGGGVAGLLVAASTVQVVIGTFMPNNHLELKVKKQQFDSTADINISLPEP